MSGGEVFFKYSFIHSFIIIIFLKKKNKLKKKLKIYV